MAHHIYKTKGFVLGTYGTGEENLFVTLLTKDLGLVRAAARSARSLRSRFRYHVQPLMFGEYALVRGREVWRLTGAHMEHDFHHALKENKEVVNFLGRYTSLLQRLLAGEEEHGDLFSLVESVLAYLKDQKPQGQVLENLEYVVVLRTLLLLGYIGEHQELGGALELSPITTDMLQTLSPLRRTMAAEINRALRESHL